MIDMIQIWVIFDIVSCFRTSTVQEPRDLFYLIGHAVLGPTLWSRSKHQQGSFGGCDWRPGVPPVPLSYCLCWPIWESEELTAHSSIFAVSRCQIINRPRHRTGMTYRHRQNIRHNYLASCQDDSLQWEPLLGDWWHIQPCQSCSRVQPW